MFAKLLLLVGCLAMPISAQVTQLKRHDTQSPTGVSYRSGTFNLSEEDLSIGGPGPEGLSLRRTYNSSLSGSGGMLDTATGWTDNFASSITNRPAEAYPGLDDSSARAAPWIYNVAINGKTYGFTGGTTTVTFNNLGHVPAGAYKALSKSGARLVFNATSSTTGTYVLTDADGTVTTFTPYAVNGRAATIVHPDGTILEYGYDGSGRLHSIFSSRGYALLFDRPNTACVVNRASIYVTPTSSCPAGVQTVNYGYTAGTFRTATSLLTSVTKNGATTTYGYAGADKLTCVRDPGATACRISNQYTICYPNSWDPNDNPAQRRWSDFIVTQQTATGQAYTYAFSPSPCVNWPAGEPNYYPWTEATANVLANDGTQTKILVSTGGMPTAVHDELGRTTSFSYENNSDVQEEVVDLTVVTGPERDSMTTLRDDRGNVYQSDMLAKPGSGLATLTTTAGYDVTCGNPKTCNKPNWVKDAKGNQTDFTYDPAHGGVLTESVPANASGIRAVKRHAYVQRVAWIKDSGSGYVQAGAPIWLLGEMRTCRATATVGNACAGGVADEVVTSYDYGPETGLIGNNLWLRGVAVTADGQTLRTCYGYDVNGNRIWETKPRANLTACS